MKARNPSTGTLETVYVKALDSMPVGTIVDYDGDTIPTGWEEVNDYSTTEIDTGKKWIDGKPIYRKCFEFVNTSTSSVKIGTIANIDRLVCIGGTAINNGNNQVSLPIPQANQASTFTFWISGNDVYKLCDAWYVNNNTQIAIIEYTKTTD